MRIAHVTDYYLPRLGGVEMHIRDLAIRQLAAGHEVEVITSSPRPADGRDPQRRPDGDAPWLADEPADEPISSGGRGADRPTVGDPDAVGLEEWLRVHRLTEAMTYPTALHPASWRAGRRLLRRGGYDVVHVHAGPATPLAYAAVALSAELPTVVTMHSLISYMEPTFKLLDVGTRWASLPAVWTAVSDVAAAPLRRLVGPAPVHVLPNGIDAGAWKVEPQRRDPDDEVLIMAVMRLSYRKRPFQLLKMLKAAHERLSPENRMRVVIAGDGPRRQGMERFLERAGMTDFVELPGRLSRSKIRELYARADMFVAPATLESFGIAALEARCAGVPVVARYEGGIREFVTHGQEGLLVDSDAAMVDAIVRLASDPKERAEIAARNRTQQPPVDWPDVLRRNEAMYELAVERVRARSLIRPVGSRTAG